jgi:hypothetical protein
MSKGNLNVILEIQQLACHACEILTWPNAHPSLDSLYQFVYRVRYDTQLFSLGFLMLTAVKVPLRSGKCLETNVLAEVMFGPK